MTYFMLTYFDMDRIVRSITYKPGWSVHMKWAEGQGGHPHYYVQLSVDTTTDASIDSAAYHSEHVERRVPWKSGKRYLSPHMCRQEVVGVVFDLIKAAELHEVHEWFRYKGASIYNPHLDPDVLAEVAGKKSSFVMRENAMSMSEREEPSETPRAVRATDQYFGMYPTELDGSGQ